MIRYLTRWTVLLTLLFLLPVALIRAQPYDDSDLRAFLEPPEGCPAPCFMGIRPGVTTADEAIAILENHAWVEFVWKEYNDALTDALGGGPSLPVLASWKWNATSPQWVNRSITGLLDFEQGRVDRIVVITRMSLGELLLVLGRPDSVQVNIHHSPGKQILGYSAWYVDDGILISTIEFCPVHEFNLLVPLTFMQLGTEATGVESVRETCYRGSR